MLYFSFFQRNWLSPCQTWDEFGRRWQNEEKEVTYNDGRTPHRIWEWDRYNGITHTQGTGNGPLERPNSVDPYEEHELVIDLNTDMDSLCQTHSLQSR